MNAPLRRVGVVVTGPVRPALRQPQLGPGYKADEYRTSDYNGRVQVAEYERQRGIIEAGGKALAEQQGDRRRR